MGPRKRKRAAPSTSGIKKKEEAPSDYDQGKRILEEFSDPNFSVLSDLAQGLKLSPEELAGLSDLAVSVINTILRPKNKDEDENQRLLIQCYKVLTKIPIVVESNFDNNTTANDPGTPVNVTGVSSTRGTISQYTKQFYDAEIFWDGNERLKDSVINSVKEFRAFMAQSVLLLFLFEDEKSYKLSSFYWSLRRNLDELPSGFKEKEVQHIFDSYFTYPCIKLLKSLGIQFSYTDNSIEYNKRRGYPDVVLSLDPVQLKESLECLKAERKSKLNNNPEAIKQRLKLLQPEYSQQSEKSFKAYMEKQIDENADQFLVFDADGRSKLQFWAELKRSLDEFREGKKLKIDGMDSGKFRSTMRQTVSYMIGGRTRFGLLADASASILFHIQDPKDFEGRKREEWEKLWNKFLKAKSDSRDSLSAFNGNKLKVLSRKIHSENGRIQIVEHLINLVAVARNFYKSGLELRAPLPLAHNIFEYEDFEDGTFTEVLLSLLVNCLRTGENYKPTDIWESLRIPSIREDDLPAELLKELVNFISDKPAEEIIELFKSAESVEELDEKLQDAKKKIEKKNSESSNNQGGSSSSSYDEEKFQKEDHENDAPNYQDNNEEHDDSDHQEGDDNSSSSDEGSGGNDPPQSDRENYSLSAGLKTDEESSFSVSRLNTKVLNGYLARKSNGSVSSNPDCFNCQYKSPRNQGVSKNVFHGKLKKLVSEFKEWNYDKVLQAPCEGYTRAVYLYSLKKLKQQFPSLRNSLKNLESDKSVVLKIYPSDEYSKYNTEKTCLTMISEHNRDNPKELFPIPEFYYYGYLDAKIKDTAGDYKVKGYYILTEFIDNNPASFTIDSFVDGLNALNTINKLGISHNDIHPRNLLVRNGEIIFIDFSHAHLFEFDSLDPMKKWFSMDQDSFFFAACVLDAYHNRNKKVHGGLKWDSEIYDMIVSWTRFLSPGRKKENEASYP